VAASQICRMNGNGKRRGFASVIDWLFDSRPSANQLIPRWLFLRGLGAIYCSAFFPLIFQIHGLIGRQGILPANNYLRAVGRSIGGWQSLWYTPTVLWVSTGPVMLSIICWVGIVASVLLVLNLWPRGMLLICFLCFLSFVSAAQDFSGYQSDGMLLEAGFLSLFFVPPGIRPGFAVAHPAPWASLFFLQWEWFRIYLESGIVKLLSGDPQWRHFTAMDEYYQNGPLPTWIGWYIQHLPHWFHAGTVFATLALELVLVWMLFLPRRWRIVCFFIVTPWQFGVILTANYAFLNYLVLLLGVLLLDDAFLRSVIPEYWVSRLFPQTTAQPQIATESDPSQQKPVVGYRRAMKLSLGAAMLAWLFYVSTVELFWMFWQVPLPSWPVSALEPFRIANRYGLFAVMTRGRYEIEFQGSMDGKSWVSYPVRYKPQALDQPPRIYAPYQPRFDWNLWFASLGSWREYPIVPNTEVRLLSNDADVLKLFGANPFHSGPPLQVRTVLWQYWLTSISEKRATGMWWHRKLLGLYAPTLERQPNGEFRVVEWPAASSHE
jgi:hypothetical protein